MGCTLSKAQFDSIVEGSGIDELFANEECPSGFKQFGIMSNTGGIREEKGIVEIPYDAMICLPRYILKPRHSAYYIVAEETGYKDSKLVRIEFTSQRETSREGQNKKGGCTTTLTAQKKITITSLSDENISPCNIERRYDKGAIEEYQVELSRGWSLRKSDNDQVLQLMKDSTIAAYLFEMRGRQGKGSSGLSMVTEAPIGLRVRQILSEAEQQLSIAIIIAASRLDIIPMCKLRIEDNDYDRKRI
jgi:hypothetical protein